MTRRNLILADVLFVIVMLTIANTGDLKKYPLILAPLILAALTTCVIRHVHYYNMNRKIY
ncbi:MAG: hypothetical protein JSU01_23115 [Bacteroidetes bacterium]|nr:hypothetical protein [Bacteroidota bacterium]